MKIKRNKSKKGKSDDEVGETKTETFIDCQRALRKRGKSFTRFEFTMDTINLGKNVTLS